MKKIAFTIALVLGFAASNAVQAQSNTAQVQNQPQAQAAPATQVSAEAKRVGFRATEWKTIHSHSEADATESVATLQKLGCEVKSENHGNHIDVKFRCVEWKSMDLGTDQLVNQWSMWCASKGMETVVVNPPANTQKSTVRFRMNEARTVHLHDQVQANQIINTLQLIGCQVKTNSHGDHMDATFSSPAWQTLELQSEASAHAWQKWLDDSGFETAHEHVHEH